MEVIRYVACYDIADDHRREDVARLLSGYGPRVQMSVFELEISGRKESADLKKRLRALIDPIEDQVRLYPLSSTAPQPAVIIGARMIEERKDFWIVK